MKTKIWIALLALIYRLGFDVSGDSFFGGDDPAIPTRHVYAF